MPNPISRDALLVRGGDPHESSALARMVGQARTSFDDGEGYTLSVGIGYDPSLSQAQLIEATARAAKLPQRLLALATLGDVLDTESFTVYPDGHLPCHANVDLGNELSEDIVKQFVGLFGAAQDNPVYLEFRRR